MREHYGYPLEWVERAQLSRYVCSDRFVAGAFDPHSGHLHPLKYCLGLGDADPNKKLPGHVRPDGSNPAGIEVGQRATGIGDLRRGSGATGIDMGAGGTGTHVGTDDSRQRRRENNEDAD